MENASQQHPAIAASVVIDASTRHPFSALRELWDYRELLGFLTWRDLKVRYKQTVLGILWALLQPLLTAAVFALVLGRFARLPSEGVPYLLLVFCGFLPWQLFSQALNEASNSVVANQRLLTKVFFPRMVIPASVVLASLLDFAVGFVLLIGMLFYYRIPPAATMLLAPLLIAAVAITGLGVGLWLSALNVRYRDVRYTLPFLTQLWFAATPVAYSSTILPENWRSVLALNPMAGFVQAFRWALLGGQPAPLRMLAVSGCVSLLLLLTGFLYFRRVEDTFADII